MPAANDLDPDKWMDLIVARAKELREAGVTSVAIGPVSITLAPHEATLAPLKKDDDEESIFLNPLDDPKTFGRKDGTPGFTRPKKGAS